MNNPEIPVGTTAHIEPEDIKWRDNGDLISREALRKEINELAIPIYGKMVLKAIDNVPTVEINTNEIEYKAYCKGLEDGKKIARPQGEWIEKQETPASISYYCSNCEHIGLGFENFCAWCGADMRGEEE